MEKRFHCGHCSQKISKTLYYEHKKLYYSTVENVWVKKTKIDSTNDLQEEFDFSDTDGELHKLTLVTTVLRS